MREDCTGVCSHQRKYGHARGEADAGSIAVWRLCNSPFVLECVASVTRYERFLRLAMAASMFHNGLQSNPDTRS